MTDHKDVKRVLLIKDWPCPNRKDKKVYKKGTRLTLVNDQAESLVDGGYAKEEIKQTKKEK